jgi:hypothetical protein
MKNLKFGVPRRDFLIRSGQTLLTLGASTFLGPIASFAQSVAVNDEDHFFVMIRPNSFAGMDVMLGLDPWVSNGKCWDYKLATRPDGEINSAFLGYTDQDVVTTSGGINLGPSAKPLLPFADSIAVVNGIIVNERDNGHPAALNYMSTGNGEGKTADVSVELAHTLSNPGPFGVLFEGQIEIGKRLSVGISDFKSIGEMLDGISPISVLKTLPKSNLKTSFEDSKTNLISNESNLNQFFDSARKFSRPVTSSQILAAALSSNVAQIAQLDMGINGLDTHVTHAEVHPKLQMDFWQKIADLFTLFKNTPYGTKGESLYDKTTFMMFSEFSRTPQLNANAGKDHNPQTNSVLLAGRNIKGNQVVGQSRLLHKPNSGQLARHMGAFYNYDEKRTGTIDEARAGAAQPILPENLVRTLYSVFGKSPDDTIPEISGAKTLPLTKG